LLSQRSKFVGLFGALVGLSLTAHASDIHHYGIKIDSSSSTGGVAPLLFSGTWAGVTSVVDGDTVFGSASLHEPAGTQSAIPSWQERFQAAAPEQFPFYFSIGAQDGTDFLTSLLGNSMSASNFTVSGEVAAVNLTHADTYAVKSFTNAFVSEIDFPALTAGSTGSTLLSVHLEPQVVSDVTSSYGYAAVGSALTAVAPPADPWSEGKFSITITSPGGTVLPITALEVGAISITQTEYWANSNGLTKDPSNLVVEVPYAQGSIFGSNFPTGVGVNGTTSGGVAKITYYDVSGNPIGTLEYDGLVFRGLNNDRIDIDQSGQTTPVKAVFSAQSAKWLR